MTFKFAKINRGGLDFIMVKSSSQDDGVFLSRLIEKFDPINRNVILVREKLDGLKEYTANDLRKINIFSSAENFENLDWKESFIIEEKDK